MPVRKASAVWNGGLRDGNGSMKFQSGAYEGKYSFASRFEDAGGTNPEELIAAAHSGCFSMALSAALGKAGFTPKNIATEASVTLEKVGEGFGITRIELKTVASVPDIDEAKFLEIAQAAKENCPVSKALKAVEITLDARLEA
jgi:osmotically inducible protein OsmC